MGAAIGACAGSAVAACGCSALSTMCGGKHSKIPYMLIMFVSVVIALVVRYWGGPVVISLYIYDLGVCTSDKCVGFGAVYRISFALFVFFAVHAALLLCRACSNIDSVNWLIKLIAYLVLLVLAWMLPNEFFDGYVHVARIVSGVFLVLQVALLIDFAIRWNQDWVSEPKNWKGPVLAVSLLLYIISLVAVILLFHYFGGDGCGLNKFFIGFTIVFTFCFSAFSITELAEHGALLPSAVVTAYMYYLLFSALGSDPSSCNAVSKSRAETWRLVVSLVISAATLTYAGWSMANTDFWGSAPEGDNGSSLLDLEGGGSRPSAGAGAGAGSGAAEAPAAASGAPASTGVAAPAGYDEGSDAAVQVHTSNAKFHAVMASAAMYFAMVLTSWGSRAAAEAEATGEASGTVYDENETSLWVKMVTQWVTGLLYTWTLVAPLILRNRDFS